MKKLLQIVQEQFLADGGVQVALVDYLAEKERVDREEKMRKRVINELQRSGVASLEGFDPFYTFVFVYSKQEWENIRRPSCGDVLSFECELTREAPVMVRGRPTQA